VQLIPHTHAGRHPRELRKECVVRAGQYIMLENSNYVSIALHKDVRTLASSYLGINLLRTRSGSIVYVSYLFIQGRSPPFFVKKVYSSSWEPSLELRGVNK